MKLEELLKRAHSEPGVTVASEIVQKAADALAAEAQEKAVNAVKGLLASFEGILRSHVDQLRELRRCEKAVSLKVQKLDLAVKYFAASGNPLPFYDACEQHCDGRTFCKQVGITMPSTDDPAWKIPGDFKPE